MTIAHVAGVDVELIGLLSQMDVGDLGTKVFLSQLLSLSPVSYTHLRSNSVANSTRKPAFSSSGAYSPTVGK